MPLFASFARADLIPRLHMNPHLKKLLKVGTFHVNIKGGTCLSSVHGVAVLLSVLLPYSFTVCEEAEKLEVYKCYFN